MENKVDESVINSHLFILLLRTTNSIGKFYRVVSTVDIDIYKIYKSRRKTFLSSYLPLVNMFLIYADTKSFEDESKLFFVLTKPKIHSKKSIFS